jgi:SAM-dependent methyltransferase
VAHPAGSPAARRDHWDQVYASRGQRQVSWYQPDPRLSAALVTDAAASLPAGRDSAVIDAGGGASLLAQRLTSIGFTDVTVLDLSAAALAAGRARPGSSRIRWINADLLGWKPPRAYQIWHDRAVFHFLVSPADRAAYLATMRAALPGGGAVILAAFAADGPEYCSGLPVARYDPAGLAAELTAAYGDAVTITGHHAEQHRTPAGAVQPFTWLTARLS